MSRILGAVAAGLLHLALLVHPGLATSNELAKAYPLQCAPGAIQQVLEQRLQGERLGTAPNTTLDSDDFHIAVLVDDGTLTIGGISDTAAIADRFYASHADVFDYININFASNFPQDINPEGGFAFEQPIANDIEGIGLGIFNLGGGIGPGISNLRSLLNMNDLGEYNEDPGEKLPGFLNTFSGVSVLAQEAAHMVGAFVNAGPGKDILGRANAHWNFFFQTYGSANEGNHWRDNGDGSYTTIASGDGYSQLDNYLFGFLDPSQFSDPMWVIQNPSPDLASNNGQSALPARGVVVSGQRVEVGIDDIVAVNGLRNPDFLSSPKTFRMAWILVIPQGNTQPVAHDLEKIDEFRRQFEEFFEIESNGVGRLDSELSDSPLLVDFEADVIAGPRGTTVEFDNDSFGSITSYTWDFGDGHTSNERKPIHTYTAAGKYSVSLTVESSAGPLTVTKDDFVLVGPQVVYFEDDFESDKGWQLTETTATSGLWLRDDPVGTEVANRYGFVLVAADVQPEFDHTPAGTHCLLTGNGLPGGGLSEQDVDNGSTSVVSPSFDLSGAEDPVLSFWLWYSNNVGPNPGRDEFRVEISSDDGASWTTLKTFYSAFHRWRQITVPILAHGVELTDRIRLKFCAEDTGGGSLVEAAVDDVAVFDVETMVPVTLEEFSGRRFENGIELSWSHPAPALLDLSGIVVQRALEQPGPYEDQSGQLEPQRFMSFVDPTVGNESAYWYRLRFRTASGEEVSPAIRVDAMATRTRLLSLAEAPDGQLQVRFSVARPSTELRIDLYDVRGRHVHELLRGPRDSGEHILRWDRYGVASRGVYFVRFQSPRGRETAKIVLRR